ncbi:MAG: peptidylprolyl isomerase [Litoreibacter sp.]|nr:peptidylprolyl isomerase [Litoreibacter sp.]
MMILKRILKPVVLAAALTAAFSNSTTAQGLFEPVITVNDTIITRYEIDQRARFLTLLRAPGDPAEQARSGLIEDRLRTGEARRAGITVTDEQIQAGMEEFATRANLSAEQFIAAIGQASVSAETFRDFVSAGLAWRTYVQGRFGPRAQVSDAEVDRALSQRTEGRGAVRLLLSEIIVPAQGPNAEANRALIQRLSDTITTEGAFAAAARQYSAAATRNRGGRLEWLPIGQVPPALRAAVLVLEPGQVTDPIPLGPGIGIFQLRALEETDPEIPDTLALEYATILIPGGQSASAQATAQTYADRYDTCDDLYKPAQSLAPELFERVTLAASDVPSDIAFELAKLDDNENSTALTRQNGEFLVFLMLCGRTVDAGPAPEPELDENGEPLPVVDERDQVRQQLFNQRLASYADSFLEELRADAIIVENP